MVSFLLYVFTIVHECRIDRRHANEFGFVGRLVNADLVQRRLDVNVRHWRHTRRASAGKRS